MSKADFCKCAQIYKTIPPGIRDNTATGLKIKNDPTVTRNCQRTKRTGRESGEEMLSQKQS